MPRRCPFTRLTSLQAHYLAAICLGTTENPRWRNLTAIDRSLRIRGLVDGRNRLTEDGEAALERCSLLSREMRETLLMRYRSRRK